MKPPVRILIALTISVATAAPAAAQVPTTPAPAPAPAQQQGWIKVVPERVGGKRATVLAGTRWRVRGTVKPYVAGQKAIVRFYRGKQKIKVKQVDVLPSKTGALGFFVLGFESAKPGRITVRATKPETPGQATLVANAKRITVVALAARPGSRGPAVRLLQRMLKAKGYVIGAPGLYDARTARAVLAFRKVTGMSRTVFASRDVFERLAAGGGAFRVRYPNHGRHIEADISRQVMVFANGSKVERIYHISSGAPGTPTIFGSFRVYRKDPGTNAKGMVHSSYFIRGYAIHGFASVPIFNASHGCLRVPVPDAMSIFRWVRFGTRVDTYR